MAGNKGRGTTEMSFTKGFRKTAADTAGTINRSFTTQQGADMRKGLQAGGTINGKGMWDNIKNALTPTKTDQFGFPVNN